MGSLLKMQPGFLRCLSHFKPAIKRTVLIISLICFHSFLFAQQQKITGKVTDENAQPLIGATVKVSGSKTAVTTNGDGVYSINAKPGQTLEITYVGKADEQAVIGSNPVID